MRMPESEELARLTELYGESEGKRRLEENKATREMIRPWVASGMSLKLVCRKLAEMKEPGLFAWWKNPR